MLFQRLLIDKVGLQVNSRAQEKGVKMFKANNKKSRSCPGVFIVNFEHVSHLIFSVSILDVE